jgi:hypothetical protein
MSNLQGLRCVAAHNGSTRDKINNWCKGSTGDFSQTSVDQGYCFGTTPNTYSSDAKSSIPDAAPGLWGNDKHCEWKAGDDIRVSAHLTAQHEGTHFVDFVPQNEAQLDGLPPCAGYQNTPFKKNRIEDFEVCVQDNVHYADGNGSPVAAWQRKSIRLHPAFAMLDDKEAIGHPEYRMKYYSTKGKEAPGPHDAGQYRIDYHFKLPNLKYDSSKPAIFRWVWFGGYDLETDCTPSDKEWMRGAATTGKDCPSNGYVGPGMGEIFINCTDIQRVHSDGPPPTTTAPTTPATTTSPETTATTAAPETTKPASSTAKPDSGSCRHYKDSLYATSDSWCEANCMYNSFKNGGCCFEANEDLCKPREHQCFCPTQDPILII